MCRTLIIKDYLEFWFWVDLVSSLPYTWFLAWSQGVPIRDIESDDQMQSNSNSILSNTPQFLRLLKIAKLLKMLKLLRVVKVKRILQKFDDYIVTDQMNLLVTFFNLTIKILFVAHYIGCFFFFYGMRELRERNTGWLINSNLVNENLRTQFITSIYWGMVTMAGVGYGDVVPITKNERVYAMMVIIFTSGIFAYTVNSIGTIVSEYSSSAASYREKMMYVNKYMIEKEMPYDLRMKIRRYLDYVFESKKEIKIDENDVNAMLNENLNDKLQMYLKGQILKKIHFIQDFGIDFMTELTSHFKKVTFVSDDFLFMEKDKAECIYFIIQGKVAMIHKQTHTFITDLHHEDYFGEVGFLKNEPRSLSAKSRDFTEVFTI
jgi:hyperpolarization activated cyclic nucleotide-gated potassium channel 2